MPADHQLLQANLDNSANGDPGRSRWSRERHTRYRRSATAQRRQSSTRILYSIPPFYAPRLGGNYAAIYGISWRLNRPQNENLDLRLRSKPLRRPVTLAPQCLEFFQDVGCAHVFLPWTGPASIDSGR